MQKYGNEIKKTAIKIIDGGFFNFKIIEKSYPPKSYSLHEASSQREGFYTH